jgi:hypothetical protein
MLEREFKYYLDNQKDLVKKHNNKFLVIKGEEVVGVYKTKQEAYDSATAKYKLGEFLIQHCLPGEQSYSQTYHSRVIINSKSPVSL